MRFLSNFKMISVLCGLLFLVNVVSASGETKEKTGALLWKISGNGLKQPSYVFGTHHFFSFNFLDSIAGAKQAFLSCEQLVGEITMNDMAAIAVEMQKAGMMHPDTTWQMLLSADDYQFVDQELTAMFGVGLQLLGMYNPAAVSMSYLQIFYQKVFPEVNFAESIDLWFQQQALLREIPILGLETVQDQTDALFLLSLKQQAQDLLCALKNPEHLVSSLNKMNNVYRSADLKTMAQLLNEEGPCPTSSEQEAALNDTRNHRWLEQLPAIMADKPSFIAVGCLHLAGEKGILMGLEKLGFIVEAVKTK